MFDVLDGNFWVYYVAFPAVLLFILNLIYQRFFMIRLLTVLMVPIHAGIEEVKGKIFKEAIGEIKSNDGIAKMEVLEVGVGAGENFRHFPQNANCHILDKTDEFLPFFKGLYSV